MHAWTHTCIYMERQTDRPETEIVFKQSYTVGLITVLLDTTSYWPESIQTSPAVVSAVDWSPELEGKSRC